MQQFERKREKLKDTISIGVQNCGKRLARLKYRNDVVTDESERLSAEEFVICQQLASKIREGGIKQAAALKKYLRRETMVRSCSMGDYET